MKMKITGVLVLALVIALFSGCSNTNEETREVCYIEQFSPTFQQWDRVVLVYGFGENSEMAEKLVASFRPKSERELRIVKVQVSAKALKGLEKQRD